jgi:hypothetical protein
VLRAAPRIDWLLGALYRPAFDPPGSLERAMFVGGRGTECVGLLPSVEGPREGD